MKNKLGIIIASLLIILVLIVFKMMFYTGNKEVSEASEDDSNLVLKISNQSQKSIKLNVHVDGNLCVEYESEGGNSHQANSYYYKASSGFHTIKAVINDGIAVKKLVKTRGERKWVIIDYWNDKDTGKKIRIRESDNRPLTY